MRRLRSRISGATCLGRPIMCGAMAQTT
jgi:hypothetical protein